jgi:hypothetical protein
MGVFNFTRFIGILGRLGSDHDGERASAAAMATRELRAAGLTWADVLQLPEAPAAGAGQKTDNVSYPFRRPDPARSMLADLADIAHTLTPARREFIEGCLGQTSPLSDRQRQVLADIWTRHFKEGARA